MIPTVKSLASGPAPLVREETRQPNNAVDEVRTYAVSYTGRRRLNLE